MTGTASQNKANRIALGAATPAIQGSRAQRAKFRLKTGLVAFDRRCDSYELALLGLDISVLYCQEGRWKKLEKLAAETFECFRTFSGNTAALGSLSLWLNAVREQSLTEALIEKVEAELQSQVSCRSKG